jgi:hypothetical protein
MPTQRNGQKPHDNPHEPDPSGPAADDAPTDRPTAESLRASARAAARRAAEAAADLQRKARAQAERFLAGQKTDAAQRIGQVGAAIRQAADRLYEDHGQGGLGQYLESAADGVDQAARYLSDRKLSDLTHDAQAFARRQPALFLGGLLLAGLALGRFAKAAGGAASEPPPIPPESEE